MKTITVKDATTIVIGRVGENDARCVVWPDILTEWENEFGPGDVI